MIAVGASMSGLRRWQIDPGCDAVGEMARARTLSCLSLAATYGQAAWLRHSQSRPPPIQRRRTNNLPPSLEEESKYPATASLSLVREMPETSSANLRDAGRTSPSALHPHWPRSTSGCDHRALVLTSHQGVRSAQIFLRRTSRPPNSLADYYLCSASSSIRGHSFLKHSCRINFSS